MTRRRSLELLHRGWPLLLAALLLAQTLGLVHRVLHAPATTAAATHDAGAPGFGHDAGDGQCRLYDQLAHGDLAFGAMPALAVVPLPAATAGVPPAGRLAPQASGFLARGPPSPTA